MESEAMKSKTEYLKLRRQLAPSGNLQLTNDWKRTLPEENGAKLLVINWKLLSTVTAGRPDTYLVICVMFIEG